MTAELTAGPLPTSRLDGVVTVTLNRPERKNALSTELRRRLAALWVELGGDDAVRCVLLIGAGDFFSAGADTSEVGADDSARGIAFTPAALPCPVVLALNGPCIGGALRFVADADVIVAAEDAWLCDPHVSLGVSSGPIAVDLAVRGHSAGVAPLVLGGSRFRMSAADAQRAGLVSEVVARDRVPARAAELAALYAAQPQAAVRTTVALLRDVRSRAAADSRAAAWAATDADLAGRDAMAAEGE